MKTKTRNLKIMDLGREIVAHDIGSKIGLRCIANPEEIGPNLLAVIAMSSKSRDARRIAEDLRKRF